MSAIDVTDTATLSALADALEMAGVSGLEITNSTGYVRIVVDTGRDVQFTPNEKQEKQPGAPILVKAPMAGHFLSHAPGEANGPAQKAAKGHVLGFIEIGPVLLPVRACHSFSSARQIASVGDLVGFGEPLFELSP